MKDLVQIDIETAITLYSKGYTHIPIMQNDPFSEDWTSKQPLYLDDLLEGLVIFASDRKRAELLNPPKVDVAKVKEEIALEFKRNLVSDDEDDWDDDPDWVETEPEQVESVPGDERVQYEPPKVLTVKEVTEIAEKMADNTPEAIKAYIDDTIEDIEAGRGEPLKWNVKDAIRYHDKGGIPITKLTKVYGLSAPTIRGRINQYKAKS